MINLIVIKGQGVIGTIISNQRGCRADVYLFHAAGYNYNTRNGIYCRYISNKSQVYFHRATTSTQQLRNHKNQKQHPLHAHILLI